MIERLENELVAQTAALDSLLNVGGKRGRKQADLPLTQSQVSFPHLQHNLDQIIIRFWLNVYSWNRLSPITVCLLYFHVSIINLPLARPSFSLTAVTTVLINTSFALLLMLMLKDFEPYSTSCHEPNQTV